MNKWGAQIRKDGLVSVLFIKEAKEKKIIFYNMNKLANLEDH